MNFTAERPDFLLKLLTQTRTVLDEHRQVHINWTE